MHSRSQIPVGDNEGENEGENEEYDVVEATEGDAVGDDFSSSESTPKSLAMMGRLDKKDVALNFIARCCDNKNCLFVLNRF